MAGKTRIASGYVNEARWAPERTQRPSRAALLQGRTASQTPSRPDWSGWANVHNPQQTPAQPGTEAKVDAEPRQYQAQQLGINVAAVISKQRQRFEAGFAFDDAALHGLGINSRYEEVIDQFIDPTYDRGLQILESTDWTNQGPATLRPYQKIVEYLMQHGEVSPVSKVYLAANWENAVRAMGYLAGVRNPIELVDHNLPSLDALQT